MAKFALTTIDNPFNPFNDFSSWYLFDESKGYKSSELLARFARTSDQLSDEENDLEIERAINKIIADDFMGIRMRLKKGDVIKPVNLSLYENFKEDEDLSLSSINGTRKE